MDDYDALSSYWRRWILPFERTIERACIRKAAAVVTVNEGIAKLIEQRFGRTAIVLRNAHDPRFEKPVDVTIRSIVGIADDEVLIVCVGQFKSGMAVEEAVKAMALLPRRFHLAFVGPGYPLYGELLARENVAGRVHFLPPVQPPEVVPFIRSADAGIVLYYPLSPSHQNCLPNGFFQPVAAGLPVVYPELPEIRRIAEQYELGVPIDPQDPASIAAGIGRLGDKTLMSRLRLNVENSRGGLSWEQEEQQLRELLENLAGLPQIGFFDIPLARLRT
jgi:glycosyltransferase involved in cell wall biosynthesis